MRKQGIDQFQVIADPSRRQILYLLSEKEMTINALAENFEMSRPAVSKHIRQLDESGFISIKTNGRERICILREDGFEEIREWIAYYDKFWINKLQKLELAMNKMNSSSRKSTKRK